MWVTTSVCSCGWWGCRAGPALAVPEDPTSRMLECSAWHQPWGHHPLLHHIFTTPEAEPWRFRERILDQMCSFWHYIRRAQRRSPDVLFFSGHSRERSGWTPLLDDLWRVCFEIQDFHWGLSHNGNITISIKTSWTQKVVKNVKSLGRFWCGCIWEWNNREKADSKAGLLLIELSSDRVKSPPSANLHIL